MKKTHKDIAIIGLGYVGLPLAVCFGEKRRVVGFDVNKERIAELKNGKDHTKECTPKQIQSAKYLSFTASQDEIKNCQIFIITVPTPVDQANRPIFTFLQNATAMVGGLLKKGDLVIYESTVFPGATEEICVPILGSSSGLEFNKDFFCGYSPERINPGDKVNTIKKIRKITSGSTKEAAEIVDELYRDVIDAGTWKAPSLKVAEAAKVIENSQRDLNIAFVNELSLIFNKLGIDTIDVLEAAGSKWNFIPFRPGMVGGHCIGVDPYYLTHKAEQIGYNPQVILAGRKINDEMAKYAARSIIKHMLNNGIDVARSSVGVLGVTFKENCPDMRNSKVLDLVEELKSWGVDVLVADPWVDPKDFWEHTSKELSSFGNESKVDSLVVAVGHDEYRNMSPEALRELCSKNVKPVLADLKSLYDKKYCEQMGFTVFRL